MNMESEKSIFDQIRKREIPTPDTAYFESLARKISENQADKNPIIINLRRRVIIWSMSAAAVIALVVFSIIPEPSEQVNLSASLQEISKEEVYAYINDHLDEFDAELITSTLPSENVGTIEFELPIIELPEKTESASEEINFDSVDDEDILEYLEIIGLDPVDLEEIEI